jgi:hypothetical protein
MQINTGSKPQTQWQQIVESMDKKQAAKAWAKAAWKRRCIALSLALAGVAAVWLTWP